MAALAKVSTTSAGRWLGRHWGPVSGSLRLVAVAIEHGWRLSPGDHEIFMRLYLSAGGTSGAVEGDRSALLRQGGLADQAEDWMNEHIAPEGYRFGWHKGEFFLWPLDRWRE